MAVDSGFRVGLYARVSSDQQTEAGTIASQLAALKERIKQDGFELEEACCFIDDGYSGATLVRPKLERLRDTVALEYLDRLYVHAPDRLARKYAYQVLLIDEFQRAGVEIVFITNPPGRSPEENLLLQVQGMISEYERARILERSRRGKLHAARNGKINVLSTAPYGYRYIPAHESGGEARYEVVFEQAQVVRQIFEWMGVERLSIGEICRHLKAQGTASPKGKPYWDRTTVWGMLKNPTYKGLAAFGKTRIGERKKSLRPQRGQKDQPKKAYSTYAVPEKEWISIPVPALIEEDLFETVKEQLAENRKRNRISKRGAKHLLQGLLKCGRCGYSYYGKPISISSGKGRKRSYAYYRCIGTDAYRFGGQRVCDNHQVRTDTLEDAVWNDVRQILEQPQRIEQEYTRRLKGPKKMKDAGQVPAGLKRAKKGIARLLDAYTEGWMSKQEFEPRMKRLRERSAQFEKQATELSEYETQQQGLRLVIGRLQEFSNKVKEGLSQVDWNSRREIIRALVKRVEVGKKAVKVVYRVDPVPFVGGPSRGLLQHCRKGGIPAPKQHLPSLCVG